jgi:hypothetical protein
MAEYLRRQHRVHAVAGMQHQILAHPSHGRIEDEKNAEPQRYRKQRALRLVDHHLVDDHLGEERRGETHQLEGKRGEQHVAPDALVSRERRNEPPEAEAARLAIGIVERRRGTRSEQHRLLEMRGKVMQRERAGRLFSRQEVQEPLAVGAQEKRRHRYGRIVGGLCGTAHETQAGKRQAVERSGFRAGEARFQAARLRGFEQGGEIVGRRKLLEYEVGVERNAMQPAQAGQRPDEAFGQNGRALLGARRLLRHVSPPQLATLQGIRHGKKGRVTAPRRSIPDWNIALSGVPLGSRGRRDNDANYSEPGPACGGM